MPEHFLTLTRLEKRFGEAAAVDGIDLTVDKGEFVAKDEPVVTLESEKATVELPAPVAGIIADVVKKKGDVAAIGETIGFIDKDGKAPAAPAKPASIARVVLPEAERTVLWLRRNLPPVAEKVLIRARGYYQEECVRSNHEGEK